MTPDYIYLSSGTWSLMGVELDQPLITPESLAYNFTNEGGACGTIRFLKNIMGLWLVQECRREWARAGLTYTYNELTTMASEAPAFVAFVDTSDERFLHPGDMVERIQGYCRGTDQPVPETPSALARCCLESLALEYRWVAERLEKLLGGSQNHLLNQFTADATGREVAAGPVEATAIGNLLIQALGLGFFATLAEGRAVVRSSFEVAHFQPRDTHTWEAAYSTYLKLKQTA
jgi:rhamnulokinase